jgi:hypothetical protein
MLGRPRFAGPRVWSLDVQGLSLLLWVLSPQTASMAQIDGPLVASESPHYFKDANGSALILTGSQTWNSFQDWGTDGSPQGLDFNAFVKFLSAHGHNFTLL